MDYFSKLAVVGTLSNANAAVAVKFFREEIIHNFGIPQQIVSGQGTATTSRLWGWVIEVYGIRHSFTTAEHQQSIRLAENNGVHVDRLAAYIADDPATWDDHRSAAVFAINTLSATLPLRNGI